MARWLRLVSAVALGGLLVAGRGRIGRFVRTVDQRAGLFAPHGAGLYDAVAPPILQPLYRRVAGEVAESATIGGLPAISAVLEIGSGPGELSLEIGRRLPGVEVVGIDLAAEMVERALARARGEPVGSGVRFQLADAAALPFTDGTFDVVVSTLSLHHWSDPAAVFAEIARVLRPGGEALTYDLRPVAYTRHELEVFLAGSPFEGVRVEREPITSGPLGLLFIRIRFVRPMQP